MVWVIGIGIGLVLLFAFPKQMMVLMGVLIAGGVVVYFIVDESSRRSAEAKKAEMAQIVVSAKVDKTVCTDSIFPVMVSFTNQGKRTLSSAHFSLSAFRPGHSNPVVTAYALESDRILAPGESYTACWNTGYNKLPEGTAPESLTWDASLSYLDWR